MFRSDAGRGQLARPGALHSKHGEFGTLDHADVERFGLLANPRKIFFPRRRVDDQPIVRVADEIDDQVVDHAALLIEHAGIQRLAVVLELGHVVGHQLLQEFANALAREIDDRHVRYVEHAGTLANGEMLLFLRTIVQRHVPAAEIDDTRAGFDVLVIERSFQTHSTGPVNP